METLFELLRQNPLLIIFLVWALISALGGVIAQQVKNANARARRARDRTGFDPMDGAHRARERELDQEREGRQELARAGEQEREWQRQRKEQQSDEQPDAEQIAAEIRRVMARERGEERAAATPAWSDDIDRGRQYPAWGSHGDEAEADEEEAYGEEAREEEAVEAERRFVAPALATVTVVPDKPQRSSLRIQVAPPIARQSIVPLHRGSRYLDLSHPARLLVAMEVLGPPVALRETGQRFP